MSKMEPQLCNWCGQALGRHWAKMPRYPGSGFHYQCLPLTAEESQIILGAPIYLAEKKD